MSQTLSTNQMERSIHNLAHSPELEVCRLVVWVLALEPYSSFSTIQMTMMVAIHREMMNRHAMKIHRDLLYIRISCTAQQAQRT